MAWHGRVHVVTCHALPPTPRVTRRVLSHSSSSTQTRGTPLSSCTSSRKSLHAHTRARARATRVTDAHESHCWCDASSGFLRDRGAAWRGLHGRRMQLASGGYDAHSYASSASSSAQQEIGAGAGANDSPWGPTPPAFAQLPRIEYVMTPSDKTAASKQRDQTDQAEQPRELFACGI